MCVCPCVRTCLNIIALLTVCLFVRLFTYFSALYFHKLRRMFNLMAIYCAWCAMVCPMYERCVTVMHSIIYEELFAHVMYILIFMRKIENSAFTGFF